MMQQQNAHLEVEDRCALGSVTSRELKPWLLARQPCRWYHWSSALDQVRFKIAVRFPWGLTFHHHGFIPDSIHSDIKSQQFCWIQNFEPQVADLGFIHLISGLESQFFSFFLICMLHDSAPMYNINQTNQFLVWNWSRSTCTICLILPSLHIFQRHFYSGKFLKCPTISPRMFVF
jgi:hypothetical protein